MESRSIISKEDIEKVDLMFEYQDASVYRWSETTTKLIRLFRKWKDEPRSSSYHSIDRACTFCSEPKTNAHPKLDLFGCDKCCAIIKTNSFDPLEGVDSVSQWLYRTLTDIIYREYGFVVDIDSYIEYDIEHDACYECGKSIKDQKEDIVMYQGSDDFAVYHLKCHNKPNRKEFYDPATYDSIIEELESDIKD